MILRLDIVWFACSVTLNKKAERLVLLEARFQAVGCYSYQTEIIRTSINRLDILISVHPLPRKKVNLQEHLYFLLDDCINNNRKPTLERILKTIVFINRRLSIQAAAVYLQTILLQKGYLINAVDKAIILVLQSRSLLPLYRSMTALSGILSLKLLCLALEL